VTAAAAAEAAAAAAAATAAMSRSFGGLALWVRCSSHLALCMLTRSQLAGVRPDVAGRYTDALQGLAFQCFDGSLRMPASGVNDNFCDCGDGSDEPGTAACAGLPTARFYCHNEESIPKIIYSSRVQDGVCDCCDGSDEAGGAGSRSCPNRCKAEGEAFQAERAQKRASILEGQQVLRGMEGQVNETVAAWQAEQRRLESELVEMERNESVSQALVDSLIKAREEAKSAKAVPTVPNATLVFNEDFEASDAIDGWEVAVGGGARIDSDPKGQHGKVLALRGCTWGGDVFSRKGIMCSLEHKCTVEFWARGAPWQGFSTGSKRTEEEGFDAHSWLAVPASNPDFADRLATTESTDDWRLYRYEFPNNDAFQLLGTGLKVSGREVHFMVQSHASTGQCADTMFDSFSVWRNALGQVTFVDADGDMIEFRLTGLGSLDIYANNELVGSNVTDVKALNGDFIHFADGYRAKAPNRTVVKAVLDLVQQSLAMRKKEHQPQVGELLEKQQPEVSEYAKWALDQQEDAAGSEASDSFSDAKQTDNGEVDWQPLATKKDSDDDPELKQAQANLESAKKQVRGQRLRLKRVADKLELQAKEPRHFSMIDACVESKIQEYRYKICYFDEAKQDSTRLGRFKGWDEGDPSVMLFTNGQKCWEGPPRSIKVHLACGPVASLDEVWEPSRCTYEARVTHPSACTEEALQAVLQSEEAMRTPREEL